MFEYFKDKEGYSIAKNIYVKSNPKTRDRIFYGGYNRAYKTLNALNEILPKDQKQSKEERFMLCYQIYLQVWIRKHGAISPEFLKTPHIKEMIALRFTFIEQEALNKMIDKAIDIIYQNEPEIKKRDVSAENFSLFLQAFQEKSAKSNESIEKKYIDDPDYGLVAGKPIFVKGIGDDRRYLDRLLTSEEKPIKYIRKCSIETIGITGPVDMYSILNDDGSEYGKIYLCVYGSTTPSSAPKGYSLKNS